MRNLKQACAAGKRTNFAYPTVSSDAQSEFGLQAPRHLLVYAKKQGGRRMYIQADQPRPVEAYWTAGLAEGLSGFDLVDNRVQAFACVRALLRCSWAHCGFASRIQMQYVYAFFIALRLTFSCEPRRST